MGSGLAVLTSQCSVASFSLVYLTVFCSGALGNSGAYPSTATQFRLPFITLCPPSGLSSPKQDGACVKKGSAWEYGFDLSNVFPLY